MITLDAEDLGVHNPTGAHVTSRPARATGPRFIQRLLGGCAVSLLFVGIASTGFALSATPAGASTAAPTVAVGSRPAGVAVDPVTGNVYVANEGDSTVSVISDATNTVTSTVSVGSGPDAVAVDSTTGLVYVANGDGTVSVISEASESVVQTISVGGYPDGIAVDPTTNEIYVAEYGNAQVGVISGATSTVTAQIPVASNAQGDAVDATTGMLYVSDGNVDDVSVIDTSSNAVVATISVGGNPEAVAIDPTTGTVYVANRSDGTASVISEATNTVTATVAVGNTPIGAEVDPVTDTAFITNADDGTVSEIDGATNTVSNTVTVGGSPAAAAYDGTAKTLYVANFNDATVSVVSTLPAQTVAFTSTAPVNPAVGTTYTPSATPGASGNPVTFIVDSATTNSACSITGGVVTFNAIGLCVIGATEAGSSLYSPATEVTQVMATEVNYQWLANGNANDLSGQHDGTWSGTEAYAPGASGAAGDQSFAFDGDNSKVLMDSTVGDFGTDNAVIAFDINTTSSASMSILGERTGDGCGPSGNGWWDVRMGNGQFGIEFGGDASYTGFSSTIAVNDGQWHHVVITRNQNGAYVTIDGQAAGSESNPVANIEPGVPFGLDNSPCIYQDSTQPFSGDLDNISITRIAAQPSATVSFNSPPSTGVVGTSAVITATGTDASPVVLSVDPSSTTVCSLGSDGATVTYLAPGNCVIDANEASAGIDAAALQVQQTISVTDPTITFGHAPSKVSVAHAPISVSATSNSGLPVTLSIDPTSSSFCSLGTDGTTLTFLGTGTCTVDANQAASGAIPAAPQVQLQIAVVTGGVAASDVYATGYYPGELLQIATDGSGVSSILNQSGGAYVECGNGTTVDPYGDVFVDDQCTDQIVEIPANGGSQTVLSDQAGGATIICPGPLASDSVGNIYVWDGCNGHIVEIPVIGGPWFDVSGQNGGQGLCSVAQLAVDGAGNIFAADDCTDLVVEIPANGGPQTIVSNKVGGVTISCPQGVAIDGSGNIYVSDTCYDDVVEIPANGGPQVDVSDQNGGATIGSPLRIAVDDAGNIYVDGNGYYGNGVVEIPADGSPQVQLASPSDFGCNYGYSYYGYCYYGQNPSYGLAVASNPGVVPTLSPQTIEFATTPPNPIEPGDTYAVAADSSSGLPVTLSVDSSTSSVCSLGTDGTTVTFNYPGNCVIDANAAGNSTYTAAQQAQQTIEVIPPPASTQGQTEPLWAVSNSPAPGDGTALDLCSGATDLYGDANSVGTVTVYPTSESGVVDVEFKITNDVLASAAADRACDYGLGTFATDSNGDGTAWFTDSANPGDSLTYEWNGFETPANFTYAPVYGQSITFSSTAPTNANVGDSYSISATGGASGNPVTFSVDASTTNASCTVTSGVVTFNHPGECVIDADQAGNGSYLAAPEVAQSISVAQTPTAVTWTTPSAISYGTALSSTQLDATATTSSTQYVTAQATSYPNDTGINLASGQSVTVSASGSWSVGGPYADTDPNGLSGQTQGCALVPSANVNELVGSLDGGTTWFVIGDGPSTVTGPGDLLLAINDCPPAYYFSDNNGSVAVAITTTTPAVGTISYSSPVGSVLSAGSDPVNATFTPSDATDVASSSTIDDLTVTPVSLVITASSLTSIYGAAPPTVMASYSGFVNGDTAASLTTAPTCVTTASPTQPVGTYPTSCSSAVDPNYTISYVGGTASITPASLVVTASSPASTYGSAIPAITPAYTGLVNGDTPTSLTTPATCSTTATSSSPVGHYMTRCSGAVDPNYSITYAAGSLAIGKATLTITASPVTSTYGSTPSRPTPSYSGFVNGDTVSSLNATPVCVTTVSSATAVGTYTGAATCSGAADPNYAVTYLAGNATVTPASLIVTASSPTSIYGSAVPAVTASYSGFVNSDTAASLTTAPVCVTGASATKPVGSYATSCSGAVDANYAITYVGGTASITPAALIVTASSSTSTYGAAVPAVTASYSGFVNSDTAASLTAAPVCVTGASSTKPVGSYATSCSGAVDANYTITYVGGTASITPAALIVTASSPTSTYGSSAPTPTPAYSGFVNGDTPASLTAALVCVTGASATKPVGTYSTSCSGAVDANYTITYVGGTASITPAGLVVTASSPTSTYGSPAPTPTPAYSGFVNGDTPASLTAAPVCVTGASATKAVGSYGTSCSGAVDANYTISYVGGTASITPAALIVTASSPTSVYGSAAPTPTPAYSGFVNGDTPASLTAAPVCVTGASATKAVGTYSTSCSGAVDANYTIAYVGGTATIGKAGLVITASSSTSVYGATVPAVTASYSGFVNGDTPASLTAAPVCVTGASATKPVGAYSTSCSGAVDANYAITYVGGTATIGKAGLVITASSPTSTYGSAAPTPTPAYSGFVNGDTASSLTTQPVCVTGASSTKPVGTYSTSCSGAVDANYTITYVGGTASITPAALVITASSPTSVYGSAAPTPTPSYSGFVNGDTPASLTAAPVCVTGASATKPVGSYATSCSGAVDANYAITYVGGTASITPAALIVTASSPTSIYGSAVPAITASYSGFVNGDTPASLTAAPICVTGASATKPVGSYATSCSGAIDANYTITYVGGTATIGKAALVITASSPTSVYGSAAPTPTASYSGFVNGDTASSLTTAPVCVTGASSTKPVGSYATSCSGAVSANYAITYVGGTASVTPAGLVVTASSPTSIYGSAVPAITASYSGFTNGDTAASLTTAPVCVTAASSTKPAGSYGTSCSGATDPNYTITYVGGTATIGKAALVVTASSESSVFGTTPSAITPTYSGFTNGDTVASLTTAPVCSTAASSTKPVGTYGTSCSGATDPNYAITYVGGTATITQATPVLAWATPLGITSSTPLSSTQLSATASSNGSSVAGTFTYAPAPGTLLPAGTDTLSVTFTPSDTADYTTATKSVQITVTQSVVTVTAGNASVLFGAPNPATFTSSVSGGSVTGTPSCTTQRNELSPGGTYPITCTQGTLTAPPGYVIAYKPGVITVSYSQACLTGTIYLTVVVGQNQEICIGPGATLYGGVVVLSGGSVDVESSTIYSGITELGAGSTRVCGSTVNGSISITGTSGAAWIGDGSDCAGNTVGGSVTITGVSGGVLVIGTNINGFLTMNNNAGGDVAAYEDVSYGVTLDNNAGGVIVTGVVDGGSLNVQGNSSAQIIVTGNSVSGRQNVQ
jgi:YVTN family beta-propeller protein